MQLHEPYKLRIKQLSPQHVNSTLFVKEVKDEQLKNLIAITSSNSTDVLTGLT